MYGLVRRHGRLPASEFVKVVRSFRAGVGDDRTSERLLATYVPLISAMVGRKSPQGSAGIQYREGATPAAIAAFFEAIGDKSVQLAPRTLHNAINERITRALEQELLSAEHALVVSAQSAWRAGNVIRTAASVSGEDVDWLTRDEVYAILGDSIRVESIHLVQNSKNALGLCQRTGGGASGGAGECGTVGVDTLANPSTSREQATGAAAIAAERLARALATLPAADARLLVDVHGLFGRKPVLVGDIAVSLGIHPSTCRRMLNRAEALLRNAVVAQAVAHGEAPIESEDVAASSSPGYRGPWCAANSAQMRKAYQGELGPGLARYAKGVAAAVLRFAEHQKWNASEIEAAVRRVVAFRTGRADASDHPLTLQILDIARTTPVSPLPATPPNARRSAAELSEHDTDHEIAEELLPCGLAAVSV
ncbi:MAG: hypothetical protein ACR2M1_15160 [Gemmatimonadaceae bacterium]